MKTENVPIAKVAEEISKCIQKYLSISNGGGKYEVKNEAVKEIKAILLTMLTIRKNFDEDDLFDEASELFHEVIIYRNKGESILDATTDYLSYLVRDKTYSGYISFEGCKAVPIGKRLGCITIVEFNKTSSNFQEQVQFYEKEQRHYGATTSSCGYFEIKSYQMAGIQKVVRQELSLPCYFLATILGYPVDPSNAIFTIETDLYKKKYMGVMPERTPRGASGYIKEYAADFDGFERVSTKPIKTSLDERILRSISIFGLARMATDTRVSFVLMISAMEGLLLTKNDNDYLGTKLAEKIAFLLYSTKEDRLKHFKRIKTAYSKRSGFVHGSESKIERMDSNYVDFIYREVLSKMFELSSRYSRMEIRQKDTEQEGIDDLINSLRFG